MSSSTGSAFKLYQSVIDDVVSGIRGSFLDEGVDEQVLRDLKAMWESKVVSSKAVDSSSSLGNLGSKSAAAGGNLTKPTTSSAASASQTQQSLASLQLVVPSDPDAQVSVHIAVPPDYQSKIAIRVPASCIQNNKLQEVLSLSGVQATLALPLEIAANVLQDQVNHALRTDVLSIDKIIPSGSAKFNDLDSFLFGQVDGQTAGNDSSSEDADEDDDEEDDEVGGDLVEDDDELDDLPNEEPVEREQDDEEALNSDDDVSDAEDAQKLFDVDNVVVCQFDKLTRARNKWKFYLKDGVMNIDGKDFVFKKAIGDAEW